MKRKIVGPVVFNPGQRFTRLVVCSRIDLDIWQCRCDCGSTPILSTVQLQGGQPHCGSDLHVPGARCTYGAARNTPAELSSWYNMWQRCTLVNHPRYKDYGGRGIIVDPHWWVFPNFLADMGKKPSRRHTLERDDNDGNYAKDNCRWASPGEQARNQRRSIFVEYRKQQWHLAELCRRYSVVDYATLAGRLRLGWPVEKALKTPAGRWSLQKYFDAAKSVSS